MAQLKDLVVNGASRFIGDIFGNKAQLTTLEAPTSAGGSTFGPGTNGQILKSNGSSLYWSDDNGGVTGVKGNAETAYRTGEVNLTAANILGSTAIGTSTTPVYWSGSAFTAGDKYAGGTAVTLNNASKAKTTASFYAPTTGGTNNTQALVGAGATTAPKWVNISTTLATSTAATDSAGQKLKVTVLGQASSEVELSKATNALYGVTKLTDAYNSADGTMATTGKALLAALQTLDVNAVGVAAATGNKFISQISETDGKISAAVSTATLGSTSLPVWVDGGVIKAITSYEGTAAKAIADANGNNIADTYLTKAAGVTDVTLNTSSQKLQKIINNTTSDIMYMPFVPGTGENSAIGGYIPTSTSEAEEAKRPKATGQYAIAYGANASASGKWSIAIGDTAIVEKPTGAQTNPNYAVAIGNESKATALNAIAIGGRNSDVGPCFAGGAASVALGAGAKIVQDAHYGISIGYGTQVSSNCGIAIGRKTESKGKAALAFGNETIATGTGSFVAGRFNIEDTTATSENLDGTYALIIGNGSEGARSNALTVNWTGNVETAGALLPMTTETLDIGSSTQKWNDVYAANFKGNADTATKVNNALAIDDTTFDGSEAVTVGKTIEYIVGTQTSTTGAWTGVTTSSQLYVGKTIAYKLSQTGSGSATLTLTLSNGTTAGGPVYAGDTRLTTHYPKNSILIMVWDGTNWRTNPYYNTNTNTLLRTYKATNNIELPILLRNSKASQTAENAAINTYSDSYGAITNAGTTTINPSTGNITIARASSGDAAINVARTDTNVKTAFMVGSDGTNRGIWDTTLSKWALYCDGTDERTELKLYGAVWNDYAEYREVKEKIEPGRCIHEIGDDSLALTTKRLERGCEIVSDTFGFAIGQTEKCNTPIAAAGRVLAYLYEGREVALSHIGWPVCSGPDGTVSIMTEEEEKEYPSRIIGTISAVPNYQVWGEDNIEVNGRVWIRIK